MQEFFNTGLYKIFEPKYKDIVGKPFITVSAKGISNGLSNIPNDGADFGPDTTLNAMSPNQTGAPYSQTSGIQEAINYCISTKTTKIYMKNGIYYITAFQTINPSYGNLTYAGIAIPQVYPDGTLVTLDIEGEGGYNWAVDSSANGKVGTIIYLKASTASTTSTTTNYIASIMALVLPSGQSSGSNALTGSYKFSNFIIRLDPTILMNSHCLQLTALNLIDGANSFIGNNLLIDVDGITNLPTPSYPVPTYISGSNCPSCNQGIMLPATNYTSNIHFTNTFVVYWPVAWEFNGDLVTLENCGHSYCNYGFAFNHNGTTYSIIKNHFHQATPNLLTIFNNLTPNSQQITIFENLQLYNVGQFGTYTPASDNNALSGIMTWSAPQDNTTINPLILTPFASGQGKYMKVTNLNIYTISPPTTPTMPTSGTAQQNTNPYPVNVYLYGGAVTEIQLTRNGTAYTVFSNASGLALSGQVYKLNPSDSITITYTTAPTWNWLSD